MCLGEEAARDHVLSLGQEERLAYKVEHGTGTLPVLVFYPNKQQIDDFPRLVQLVEKTGAHIYSGIAKIVPPHGWHPRPNKKDLSDFDQLLINSPVRERITQKEGVCDVFIKEVAVYKKTMTVKEFRSLCHHKEYKNPSPNEEAHEMDSRFWASIVEREPIYGADTEGSLYDQSVPSLNVGKLGTLLDELPYQIHGVNTVYLYFGMYKTMFPWHAEDMDLYSINYLHDGAPKHWYAVSAMYAERFEKLLCQHFPKEYKGCRAFLRHKNFILAPSVLRKYGIPYGTMTQKKNEFIITFPKGYHMGYNTGFNIAESTNFASERWIDFGKNAQICKCRSDSVEINMEGFMKRYRPQEYMKWLQYWYGTAQTTVDTSFNKKNFMKKGINYAAISARKPKRRKIDDSLWQRSPLMLYAERKHNEEESKKFPHCAVCAHFCPSDIAKWKRSEVVPNRSVRLISDECLSKHPSECRVSFEEDSLVTCVNCLVTVHTKCYPVGCEENWHCLRCKHNDDVRIRAAACALCELRGGALIPNTCGEDRSFVHVVCAIMNRRTMFLEGGTDSYTEPPPRHGYDSQRSQKLLPAYRDAFGDALEVSRYQCSVCCTVREGLIECVACRDEGWSEPRLAHTTCASLAGFSLQLRDFPQVAVMVCDRHLNNEVTQIKGELAPGTEVWATIDDVTVSAKIERPTGVIGCVVDMVDSPSSSSSTTNDISWCLCARMCNEVHHVAGSPVEIGWTGSRRVGYFRQTTAVPPSYIVRISSGESRALDRRDVTLNKKRRRDKGS